MPPKKEVKAIIKLQVTGAQANPAPPVGPALGQHGLNIMEFCKQFNERTKEQPGVTLPVEITAFVDRTFTFIVKTPPAAYLLLQAAKVKKGSGIPHKEKVGKVSWKQCLEIGELKMQDLNAMDVEAAARQVAGTARSMGLEVVK
jgi:large subunit ribosomal protein L11